MPSAFEYDESDESDEGVEAAVESDESFESDESDEAYESDEAAFESDESDESFESDEAAFESDEAAFESDEAAESDESVTFSASAGTSQDQRNRAQWQAKIAADRRRDVQAASATQRAINQQIRVIQRNGRARIQSVRPLTGMGVFVAELENGRRARMRTNPAMASVREVNQVRAALLANEKRAAAAIEANRKALAGLAKAQAEGVKKQLQHDQSVGKRLVEINNRITKELSNKGQIGAQRKRLMRLLKGERRRNMLNNVLVASAMPFFAAYGNRSSPFHRDNLVLSGSLIGFLVGDELIQRFAPAGKSGKTLRSGANAWSYLATPAFGATSWYLFKDRLNQRFATGTVDISLNSSGEGSDSTVKLTIPEDSVEDFKKVSHPVVATIMKKDAANAVEVITASSSAVDSANAITLSFAIKGDAADNGKKVTVAWMIDLKPSEG